MADERAERDPAPANVAATSLEQDYGATIRPPDGRKLVIAAEALERLRHHGEVSYPEECCGILVGRPEGKSSIVERLHPAHNEHQGTDRRNRFLIPPATILEAQRAAARDGFEILGYYHSHPDCPAKPSEHDRDAAWPATSYVIVSVVGGRATEHRSWRLDDDRSAYREEEIDVLPNF